MATIFSEKLDRLMTLTGTTNSMLARALNFDTSHISRIRRGERGVPRKQPFIEPAGTYFARKIREPYLISAAEELLQCGSGQWPGETDAAAKMLTGWLSDDAANLPRESAKGDRSIALPEETDSFFFGNAGKRKAVLLFLDRALAEGASARLTLHSDENMSWLTEDRAFLDTWMQKMAQILRAGGRVRIAHSLSRDITEMLQAIRGWMPLYMCGHIEPFYCPRIRDGIYKRTCFILQGKMAITSLSIGEETEGMGNVLITGRTMVRALEKEQGNFFALCRPVMRIYRTGEAEAFDEEFQRFLRDRGTLHTAGCPQTIASLGESLKSALSADEPPQPAPRQEPSIAIAAKEEAGAFVFPLPNPGLVFFISEQQLLQSILEYLRRN
ncbi:MAG: hypothetical protein K5981_05145 [Clostridia bacterium]|nr:hypothetical protein [Clostridia bacterium]